MPGAKKKGTRYRHKETASSVGPASLGAINISDASVKAHNARLGDCGH